MSDIPAYDAQNDKSILVSQNVGYERSRKVRMNSAPSSRKNIILLLIILLSFFPNLFYFITRLPLNLLNHWGPTNPTSSAQPSPAPAPPPPNMSWAQKTITLPRKSRGCYLITDQVQQELPEIRDYKVGLLHLFIQHTSCALSINENWDKDVQVDMNDALNRLVPENGRMYRHSAEGSDDMPAHIKTALIGPSVTIPITDGRLNFGTWQGVWLLEFRTAPHVRKVVATIQGEKA